MSIISSYRPDLSLVAHGLIDEQAQLERVHTGSIWAEGPLWIPKRDTLRWSDIPADCIWEYTPSTDSSSIYAENVEFTNGRALDRDGSVIQCSHGRRRVERDIAGIVEPLIDSWGGARLNSPNDVIIHPDGSIWFSDPPYGIVEPREGHAGEREYDDHFVFRYDPSAAQIAPVITDVEEPNGLAFSPDLRLLYVADSSSVRRPRGIGNRCIRVYDIQESARCKNGRVFTTLRPADGFSDGIKVDTHGNVWSSSAIGVIVFSPSGNELGRIRIPELTGNLCFGGTSGTDLYIAASTSIYRLPTRVRDARA